jgi:hypothetical protein
VIRQQKVRQKAILKAKTTATPEPEKDITPRGRMKALIVAVGNPKKSEPTINVPEGGTAVERMKRSRG